MNSAPQIIPPTEVESSNLDTVSYNGVLTVKFKGGATWRYYAVPQEVVEDMLTAESIGRYFSQEIKSVYPGASVCAVGQPTAQLADDHLTAPEALLGFVGWLTTNGKQYEIGPGEDCAVWAEVIKEFCDANDLGEPRDGWDSLLVHPS